MQNGKKEVQPLIRFLLWQRNLAVVAWDFPEFFVGRRQVRLPLHLLRHDRDRGKELGGMRKNSRNMAHLILPAHPGVRRREME